MSERRHEDVVILGAGPAGCTAARLLSTWGRRVVIVTRAPSRHVLAESLPPSATKLLDRTGLRHAVDMAGFIRATGNTVRWGGQEVRVEGFAEGLGYQLPRDRFDALMLAQAADAGASVVWGVTGRIVPDRKGDGCVAVQFHFGGFTASLRAPWVLDCTGQKRAARQLAYEQGPLPRTLALAAVWESDRWKVPEPTHTLVESYDGGWAWSVPQSMQRRFVTVMLDPSLTPLQGRRMIEAEYRRQLARAEWMQSTIPAGAQIVGEPFARDATPFFAGGVASEGVLRVGDAASFVDPMSSYGIKKALASGWLAAVVVNTCLDEPSLAAHATELHEERERAMYTTLSRRAAALAGSAGATGESAFWRARLDDGDATSSPAVGGGDPDSDSLRTDPRVATAFAELKSRDRVRLRPGGSVGRIRRPVVEGERVVLREHLVGGAVPGALCWFRSVDLPHLQTLAPEHEDVGALYEAYCRSAPPVPLPDFLSALSALIATDALEFA